MKIFNKKKRKIQSNFATLPRNPSNIRAEDEPLNTLNYLLK
jgi:hypothetical protein